MSDTTPPPAGEPDVPSRVAHGVPDGPLFSDPWDSFGRLSSSGAEQSNGASHHQEDAPAHGVDPSASPQPWLSSAPQPPSAYPLDPPGSAAPPLPVYSSIPTAPPLPDTPSPAPAASASAYSSPQHAAARRSTDTGRGADQPAPANPDYPTVTLPPPLGRPAPTNSVAPAQSAPPAQSAQSAQSAAADQSPRPEALLAPNRPDMIEAPAGWGWRGRLNKLTGGLLKLKPTADELADRQARVDVQRGFSKPMTVVVIQPKGGAGKTPTTIGIASALGVHRGGYVLGWDDNETRGTLAVRVKNLYGQTTTAWDLLGSLSRFERADARVGDLSQFVRAQGEAQFDALASDDNPANMAQIGEEEFSRLHDVLQRFYRIIVIDTGNNVRSPNWQAAVNAADLVVVVSTYQRDVGYSGSWVLDHLGQTGRGALAGGAVTVLTAADPHPDPTVRRELLSHFGTRTRSVVEIPYDPHIAVGGPMEWSLMREETRRAWTLTGAAVVDALAAAEGTIP
jgi:MinD-like ATPase involved in chromosome partitioning or flagellar assembly